MLFPPQAATADSPHWTAHDHHQAHHAGAAQDIQPVTTLSPQVGNALDYNYVTILNQNLCLCSHRMKTCHSYSPTDVAAPAPHNSASPYIPSSSRDYCLKPSPITCHPLFSPMNLTTASLLLPPLQLTFAHQTSLPPCMPASLQLHHLRLITLLLLQQLHSSNPNPALNACPPLIVALRSSLP